jgi:hypothetical protein
MIGNIKEISKPFWKYISSTRKDTQSIPPLDTKQGTTTESDVDKAEALNDQFTALLWSLLRVRIIILIDCVIRGSDFFPLHIFDGTCFSTAC